MTLERFVLNSSGAREILRSSGVRADLESRARRVKAAAQPHTDRDLIADSYTGRNRAGATVIGTSITEETERRTLGSAIDAAR